MHKCVDCNLCLDVVYLPDNRRFLRCWLCGRWYYTVGPTGLIPCLDPIQNNVLQLPLDMIGELS